MNWWQIYLLGAVLVLPVLWVINFMVYWNQAYFLRKPVTKDQLALAAPGSEGIEVLYVIAWPLALLLFTVFGAIEMLMTWFKYAKVTGPDLAQRLTNIANRDKKKDKES